MRQHEWGGLGSAFWEARPLVGMVHLSALPGSAGCAGGVMEPTIHQAVSDARALAEGGASAIIVENFYDAPFAKNTVPPHTIAALTRAVLAVRSAVSIPVGVNCLRNDACGAIAIAHICGANFVRVNVFVGAAVTDQGLIEGCAREAVLYRKSLSADVAIWADVCVKHAVQLGSPDLADQARDAVTRGLADALIVSGPATGRTTSAHDANVVKSAVPGSPLLVGSGFSVDNVTELLQFADGAIVGTSVKREGLVQNSVDSLRVRRLRAVMDGCGSGQTT